MEPIDLFTALSLMGLLIVAAFNTGLLVVLAVLVTRTATGAPVAACGRVLAATAAGLQEAT
jgi:hypothetical protein